MAKSSDVIYIRDGSFSWAGGVDSSLSTTVQTPLNPDGLPRNELAWLNNATVRGGGITQRAGWQPLVNLPQGYWQGQFTYEPDFGFPYVVCVISGVVYRVDLQPPYQVTDLTGGDPNLLMPSDPAVAEMAFFCQAESYLVIQAGDYFSPGPVNPPMTDSAGRTLPLFWDGTILRRSVGIIGPVNIPGTGHLPFNEIPAATVMDYYENRLWYGQGRKYSAGDIVGDRASGGPAVEYRDAVLKVTENPLAIGGDGFTVPTQAGNIRAIVHASQLNASLGQGSLYVGTRKAIYNPQVPITRADWIGADASNMPSQPIVQLVNGPSGHRSIIPINGDLYYQSFDPAIRSLIRAVQYFAQPGNTAISQNVNRVFKYTDRSLMRFSSSIYFDSRFLTLTLPKIASDGVNIIHQAILALDFDVVTNLSGQNAAVWEGAYDGLQFIELIGVDYNGLPRALAAIVSALDNTLQLWELTQDSNTENGDNRVTWSAEFPAYTWAPGGYETELKQLAGGELWVDRVSGTVQLDVYYRPDGDPCWRKWFNTKFCAARNQDLGLASDAYPCEPLNEGSMYPVVFPEPCGSDCDAMRVRPTTIAYQFQVKIVLKGFCRIRGLILYAQPRIKPQYQGLDVTSCQGNVLGAMADLPFKEQPQTMPVCAPPGSPFTAPPPDVTPKSSFSCSILTSNPMPGANELTPYSLQLEVQADLLGWTAEITSGALPPGLTMTNGGYISGTPTTVGTYTFRLTVTKTTFMTCYQDFTLVVSAPICTITSDSPLPSGTVGTPYSTQLTVDAAATVTGWTISNGTLPNGLTMDATGLITGTPTDVQSMTFTVSVTGTDGMTCSKAFTLNTIMVCTIAARVDPNFPANASVSGTNLTLHSGQDSCIIIEATPSVIQGVSGSWNYVGDTQILPGVYVSNVVTQNFCSGYYPGAPIGVLVVGTCGVFNAPTGSAAFTVRATKLDGTYCEQTFTVNVV
jgi:hypothetical protein